MDREGPRASEAIRFDLSDVDLARGAIKLDKNKTNDPRAWALDAGVVRALSASVALRERDAKRPLRPDEPLFTGENGRRLHPHALAEQHRNHLALAGVDRAELFETISTRRKMRLHDTRATFITIALANEKTETWVADRTGHRSSDMINRYRRTARTAAELGLGTLRPLDEAIPELGAGVDPRPRRKRRRPARPGRRRIIAKTSLDRLSRGSRRNFIRAEFRTALQASRITLRARALAARPNVS